MMDERDKARRRIRLSVGAGSSLPIAIVVTFLYHEVFHKQMDNTVAVAIASLIGSFGTGLALCFHDIRALICGMLIKNRIVRRARRAEDEV